jgi:ankyrin repeat protein
MGVEQRRRDQHHWHALHNHDVVKFLMEHGVDLEKEDSQEDTPLHLAAVAWKTDSVKFLLEQWPEGTRVTNELRATPLHLAIFAGHTEVVRLLVEAWPEGMREREENLSTPLHLASEKGGQEVLQQ